MTNITKIAKIIFSKTVAQRIQTRLMYICIDVSVGSHFNCINNVIINYNIDIIHAYVVYM